MAKPTAKSGADKRQLFNFVKLTARVGQAPEMRHSAAGAVWTKCRVAVGMGKDSGGAFKPALWLTAKAFGKEGDDSMPVALNALEKGTLVTLSGRLVYEEYQTTAGDKRSDLQIIVTKIEPVATEAPSPEDAAFDPPL